MDQLQRARDHLLKERPPPEDKKPLERGVSSRLHELKDKNLCGFCEHPSFIQVDDSAVTLCMHCFKVLEENLSSMKAFLGCR